MKVFVRTTRRLQWPTKRRHDTWTRVVNFISYSCI